MPANLKQALSSLVGVVIGAGYGLLARYVFVAPLFEDALGIVTIGFLCFVPLGLGVLTVVLAPENAQKSLRYALLMPWVSAALFNIVLVGVLQIELLICIVLASPLIFALSSIGGSIGYGITKSRDGHNTLSQAALVFTILLPFIITPVESLFEPPDVYRNVETSVVINATPAEVWVNIVRVAPIQDDEQSATFSAWIGISHPLEAEMRGDGLDGTRYGYFEDGLRFVEEITVWTPGQAISFDIRADTSNVTHPAFKQIGGQYFEVIHADYRIEQLDEDTVILHLGSTHRLSTHFNRYSSIWTILILREFQMNVLHVVKDRAEAEHNELY